MSPGNAAESLSSPPPVDIFVIEQHTVPEWSEYHGVVGSRNTVQLIALTMGRIKAVNVKAGQRIRKGEILVELESDEHDAKLRAAQSRQVAAEAALAEASVEHDRIEELIKIREATNQQLDKSTASLKSAQAGVEVARAQAEESRTLLAYTVLKSPMNGIVVDKRVNPGDFTIPGLPADLGYPAGRILMTIYDPDALWFEARIPERYSQQIAVGTAAMVSITSANLSLEGKFIEVLTEMDEVTRTFTARVNLPPLPSLKLGMFGRARFVSGQRKLIEIPEKAVVNRGQLDTVFVLSDERARLRLVRGGKRSTGKVEILSGLSVGERVILNPREGMRDGDLVAQSAVRQ